MKKLTTPSKSTPRTLYNTGLRAVVLALALVIILPLVSALAAPSQPQNVRVSGNPTQPTVSWDSSQPQPNGAEWDEITASAQWSARQGFGALVFDNKMLIMGGADSGGNRNDVWSSTDGVNWTQATANAAWPARSYFGTAVFDNKMWVMGGFAAGYLNDVWYSEDGVTWIQATANAAWPARSDFTSLALNNKLWIIGGGDNDPLNDVWHSEDGVTWIQATANAAWPARYAPGAAVFAGKMWMMGGWDNDMFNDVWHSEDGVTWIQATANAAWSGRANFGVTAFDNQLWVMAGWGNGGPTNDVWSSTDGENWSGATADAQWSARSGFTTAVFGNAMWAMGGQGGGGGYLNDVWASSNQGISHYVVCWDKVENGCANSAQVSPDGDVLAATTTGSSWLEKLGLGAVASAQSSQLSYTLTDPLSPGSWYFSVYAVNYSGEQSVLGAAALHTINDTTDNPDRSLADTGDNTSRFKNIALVLITLSSAIIFRHCLAKTKKTSLSEKK